MNCERCGKPYRYYSPWYEPPENHYYRCDHCNRTVYPYDPGEEEVWRVGGDQSDE